MRYELADYKRAVIRTMLPNKPRGVPRVDERRVLTGTRLVIKRTLARSAGDPYTTCYKELISRYVRFGSLADIARSVRDVRF